MSNKKSLSNQIEVFTFGDPEPALNQSIMDYIGVFATGQYYDPPISFNGLAKSLHSCAHHASAILFKRNLLTRLFKPSSYLSRKNFAGFVMDYLSFGNGFIERINNRKQELHHLRHAMASYTRVGIEEGTYFLLPEQSRISNVWDGWGMAEQYENGTILQLSEPDLTQNIYGVPDYLAALQSAWLNEAATLFRRRYYVNGTHAGYILYITDPLHEQVDVDELKSKIKDAKGPGNFRNLLLYAPGGRKEGMQLIHTAEAAAKDEFLRIKSISRDDVLAAHRVPPQLLGIVPENNGGFGSAKEAMGVFYELEICPLIKKLESINDWLDQKVVDFQTPHWNEG